MRQCKRGKRDLLARQREGDFFPRTCVNVKGGTHLKSNDTSKSSAPTAPSSRRYSAKRSKSRGSFAPPHASPDAAAPDAVVPGAGSFLRADEADVYRGREMDDDMAAGI